MRIESSLLQTICDVGEIPTYCARLHICSCLDGFCGFVVSQQNTDTKLRDKCINQIIIIFRILTGLFVPYNCFQLLPYTINMVIASLIKLIYEILQGN